MTPGRGVATLLPAVEVDGQPAQTEPGHRGGRRRGVDDEEPVRLGVPGAADPFGHRIGDAPVPGAAAQRRRRLGLVGTLPRIEVPGAQFGERRPDQLLALLRGGFGQQGQAVAPGRLERLVGGPPVLRRLLAELADHADARARARRMRCTSMLPEATVEAWA